MVRFYLEAKYIAYSVIFHAYKAAPGQKTSNTVTFLVSFCDYKKKKKLTNDDKDCPELWIHPCPSVILANNPFSSPFPTLSKVSPVTSIAETTLQPHEPFLPTFYWSTPYQAHTYSMLAWFPCLSSPDHWVKDPLQRLGWSPSKHNVALRKDWLRELYFTHKASRDTGKPGQRGQS